MSEMMPTRVWLPDVRIQTSVSNDALPSLSRHRSTAFSQRVRSAVGLPGESGRPKLT